MSSPTNPEDDTAPGARPLQRMGITPQTNLLRHYSGVIRRRYRWILLGLVVGLIAGLVSTLFVKPPKVAGHFYRATNTVVVNGTDQGASGQAGLQSGLLIVQSQALIDQVASTTHVTPIAVSERVNGTIRNDGSALDITAIATDPALAVKLANTAAADLNAAAAKAAQEQYDQQRASLTQQIEAAHALSASLTGQIATNPPNVADLTDQLTSSNQNSADLTNQLQQLGPASSGPSLSTLQPARAIEINARGYTNRRRQNINSRGLPAGTQSSSNDNASFDELDLSVSPLMSKSTRTAIGVAAGLVLGVISAFLIEAWDDRLRRRDQVELVTELAVLAELPRFSRSQSNASFLAVIDEPSSAAAERFRAARTSILFAIDAILGFDANAAVASSRSRADDGGGDLGEGPDGLGRLDDTVVSGQPNNGVDVTPLAQREAADAAPAATAAKPKHEAVIMVTSPSASDGKSTTVANLAASFAEIGMRTLVVDGDFRRSGATTYLATVPNLVDPSAPASTRADGVSLISIAHNYDTPAEAIVQLRDLIDRWRSEYDIVLVDTPPILATNDATDLLTNVDGTLLVIRSGQTRLGPAERAGFVLDRYRAQTLGAILNGCDRSELDAYYGKGYGYGYGYGQGKSSGRGRSKSRKDGDARKSRDATGRTNGQDDDANGPGRKRSDKHARRNGEADETIELAPAERDDLDIDGPGDGSVDSPVDGSGPV